MLSWYRDIFDEELIAAWQGDQRANLPPLIEPLTHARVASAVIEFSWRRERQAIFNPIYAPMLGDLMARYSGSAKPFLEDLLGPASTGQRMPDLSLPEAGAVCRILPIHDLNGGDRERSWRAQRWLAGLKAASPL